MCWCSVLWFGVKGWNRQEFSQVVFNTGHPVCYCSRRKNRQCQCVPDRQWTNSPTHSVSYSIGIWSGLYRGRLLVCILQCQFKQGICHLCMVWRLLNIYISLLVPAVIVSHPAQLICSHGTHHPGPGCTTTSQRGRKSGSLKQLTQPRFTDVPDWVTTSAAVQPTFKDSDSFNVKWHGRQLAPRHVVPWRRVGLGRYRATQPRPSTWSNSTS